MAAELLYHTILKVVDYNIDRSGSTQTLYVLGTHTELKAAKQFAANALQSLGYVPEEFAVFESHQPGQDWRHGDGVMVYAKAYSGQELFIEIITTPNNLGLASRDDGTPDLPEGSQLYYVLQSKVDYNIDRSGAAKEVMIEGCFLHRGDAVKAAKECLIQAVGPREQFIQYDERPDPDTEDDVGLLEWLPF